MACCTRRAGKVRRSCLHGHDIPPVGCVAASHDLLLGEGVGRPGGVLWFGEGDAGVRLFKNNVCRKPPRPLPPAACCGGSGSL